MCVGKSKSCPPSIFNQYRTTSFFTLHPKISALWTVSLLLVLSIVIICNRERTMGCVSSTLLNHDQDLTHLQFGIGHHIVSLTSTTYGLLTLDPPTTSSDSAAYASNSKSSEVKPEVINSWELMAGLDAQSFRFYPLDKHINTISNPGRPPSLLDKFKVRCPSEGDNRVVIYTTTLRGVPKTFERCNSVRAVLQGLGIMLCERDISMDRRFREELCQLLKGEGDAEALIPPRVFVRGRYIGGAEEVLKLHEEGNLIELLRGLPRIKGGFVCDGCGNARFLPCFTCSGSCKMMVQDEANLFHKPAKALVVRCPDCNENGLVLCPICC